MRFLISFILCVFSFSLQAMQITEMKMTEAEQAKWLALAYPHGKIFNSNDERIRSERESEDPDFKPDRKARLFWKIPKKLIKETEIIEWGPANHVLFKFERAFRVQHQNKTHLFIMVNATQIGDDLQETLTERVCASCDGVIGLASIDITNATPVVVKIDPFFSTIGHRGAIPQDITITKIGPDKEILRIKRIAGFINASDEVTFLLDPEKQRILFIAETQSCVDEGTEDERNSPDKDKTCLSQQHKSKVRILSHLPPKNGYYLLDVRIKGHFFDKKKKRVIDYAEHGQYFFNGKTYVLEKSK